MNTPREIHKYPIVWTNDLSQPIPVSDFRNIGLTIAGIGSVSVLGSKDKTVEPIDFASSSTLANSYATIAIYDETVTTNNWVTSLTVNNATKLAEIDTNLLTWICLSRTTASIDNPVDAFITVADNA